MKKLFIEELIVTEDVSTLGLGVTEVIDSVVGAKTYRTFTIPNKGNTILVKVESFKISELEIKDTFFLNLNNSGFEEVPNNKEIELDI